MTDPDLPVIVVVEELSARVAELEAALRDLLEPWDADCEDCADEDGFCEAHLAKWMSALTRARAALVGTREQGEA